MEKAIWRKPLKDGLGINRHLCKEFILCHKLEDSEGVEGWKVLGKGVWGCGANIHGVKSLTSVKQSQWVQSRL